MRDALLLGLGRHLVHLPRFLWRRQVAAAARKAARSLAFMTDEHHSVRDFVVREMARRDAPLPPPLIAAELGLPVEHVVALLEELERRLIVLYRDAAGAVEWAYPHSAARTPHRLAFSTGEVFSAA